MLVTSSIGLSFVGYCQKRELPFEFELFELEQMEHLPTLHHIIHNLKCNVVLYSIYALPANAEFRGRILDAARDAGIVLHFANEDLSIANQADCQLVEDTLAFGKYGDQDANGSVE